MRVRITILWLIALPNISFGQIVNDSLLATFYNKTLSCFFPDSITHKDQLRFGNVLVKTDFDAKYLIKTTGKINLKYFNDPTPVHAVLKKPHKKNKGRSVYWIKHKTIGTDTIDVNIGGWTVLKYQHRHLHLAAWCGGDMGYIPEGRFIFDKEKRNWRFQSYHDLWEIRFNEDMEKIKSRHRN
jgi:hypothetical protein